MSKRSFMTTGRKILASALSAAMVVGFTPVVAFAEGESGTSNLPAVDNKGVITLANDVEVSDLSGLDSSYVDGKLTIDLNGHRLTYTGPDSFEVTSGGKSLLIENGSFLANSMSNGTKALFSVKSNSSISLDNVSLETNGSALLPLGTAASVNVRNSDITCGVYAVGTNAAEVSNHGVVINLQNSTFTTRYGNEKENGVGDGDSCPILINVPGKLDMTGCTVNGTRQGVIVRGGDASIVDSQIILGSTDTYSPLFTTSDSNNYLSSTWRSGNEVPQAALVVGDRNTNSYQYRATCVLQNTLVTAPTGYSKVYTYGEQSVADNAILESGAANTPCAYFSYDSSRGMTSSDIVNGEGSNATVVQASPRAFTCSVGDEQYCTLIGAVHATPTGGIINMTSSVSDQPNVGIRNKSITVNLAGQTLGFVGSPFSVKPGAELTITDTQTNGKVVGKHSITVDDAKFTLDAGDIEVFGGESFADKDYGIYAFDNGKVYVNGGSISSDFAPLTGNNTTGDMNFYITDGTMTATYGPAIYMPGQCDLQISGGTLNGGISLRMGQVEISNGTINSITSDIDNPKDYYSYSGNAWFPDAIYVTAGTYTSKNATYGNSLNMVITGGTINCNNDKGSAIAIYDLAKVEQTARVSISGSAILTSAAENRGSYQVLNLTDIEVTSPETGYNNEAFLGKVVTEIAGGTFSEDPVASYKVVNSLTSINSRGEYSVLSGSAAQGLTSGTYTSDPTGHLASGYKARDNGDGTYTVYDATPSYDPDPAPITPTPTPEPPAPEVGDNTQGVVIGGGSSSEGGSSEGTTTVDITVTDTTPATDSQGNKVDGTVSIDSISTTESSVTIPETITTDQGTFLVTSIPAGAMEDNTTVTSVEIPSSVTSIGEGAFAGCTNLTSVTVPAGVTTIEQGTFAGCTSLETVEVQGDVTSIAPSAFEGCSSLTTVDIPSTVTTIGEGAFAGCSSLTSTTIPAGVTTIESSTFAGCTNLETVEVKGELTEIAADAFNGCTNLTGLTTAGGIQPLAASSAKALAIPASVTKVGDRAFMGTGIASVTVPAGVQMGTGVFRNCKLLAKATVEKGVKTLSSYTFKGCTALTSVTLPSGITAIQRSVFSGCKALKSVTIPKTVTSIGKNALYGASKVKTLTVNSKKLTKSSVKGALAGSKVTTVKVPKSMLKTYAKVFAKSVTGKTVKLKAIA